MKKTAFLTFDLFINHFCVRIFRFQILEDVTEKFFLRIEGDFSGTLGKLSEGHCLHENSLTTPPIYTSCK